MNEAVKFRLGQTLLGMQPFSKKAVLATELVLTTRNLGQLLSASVLQSIGLVLALGLVVCLIERCGRGWCPPEVPRRFRIERFRSTPGPHRDALPAQRTGRIRGRSSPPPQS